ncbi:hypothetical protein WS48_28110 [Burkholderia sp. RF7-non_BP1]|nr:hypothetical protein WS48_28110 [Burkholderia sp. RF7-non_BP1]KUY99530.1 hypothetical protein WS49_18525 [Burkholderia sp. RF7-non_BP4]
MKAEAFAAPTARCLACATTAGAAVADADADADAGAGAGAGAGETAISAMHTGFITTRSRRIRHARIVDAPPAAWPRRRLPDMSILGNAPARGADRQMTNSKSTSDAAPSAQITAS